MSGYHPFNPAPSAPPPATGLCYLCSTRERPMTGVVRSNGIATCNSCWSQILVDRDEREQKEREAAEDRRRQMAAYEAAKRERRKR